MNFSRFIELYNEAKVWINVCMTVTEKVDSKFPTSTAYLLKRIYGHRSMFIDVLWLDDSLHTYTNTGKTCVMYDNKHDNLPYVVIKQERTREKVAALTAPAILEKSLFEEVISSLMDARGHCDYEEIFEVIVPSRDFVDSLVGKHDFTLSDIVINYRDDVLEAILFVRYPEDQFTTLYNVRWKFDHPHVPLYPTAVEDPKIEKKLWDSIQYID